jgi:Protein-tyrosine phosphatase
VEVGAVIHRLLLRVVPVFGGGMGPRFAAAGAILDLLHLLLITTPHRWILSQDKCFQYWPVRGVQKIGKLFKVMNFGEPVFSSDVLLVTKLQVENLAQKCSRDVYHFQYKEWPDHGLPKSTETFRHLLHIVDKKHDHHGPILVHCRFVWSALWCVLIGGWGWVH